MNEKECLRDKPDNTGKILNLYIPRYEKNTCVVEKSEDGKWVLEKYANGLIKMYHKLQAKFDITNNYVGSNGYGIMWCQTPMYKYPLKLIEIYSSQTTIVCAGHLTNFNYNHSSLDSYQGYLYDDMNLSNQTLTIYTVIFGKWK